MLATKELRPRSLAGATGIIAAAAALAVPVGATAATPAASKTKTYTTPGSHSFKVPDNVARITVKAIGAAGGDCVASNGGEGATLTATVKVKPGATLVVGVGGAGGLCTETVESPAAASFRAAHGFRAVPALGATGAAGGVEGGGPGGSGTVGGGPGGGGASGVGTGSLGAGGGALVVAGGGGGAGWCGGAGGNAGSAGTSGGDCGSGGDGGPGGPGTHTSGGPGGTAGPGTATAGATGTAGSGGAGGAGDTTSPSAGGAGGGGGYYGGGGGGGAGNDDGNAGGGGGGSSFTAEHATHVKAATPTTAAPSVTITYAAQPPPVAITHRATNVKSHSATIHGSVNPKGLKTTYYFQYGMSTKYGKKTAKLSLKAGMTAKSVEAMLHGLQPSTTYHFRVVAHNASGTAHGKDLTFTTPSVAPAFTG